MFSSQFTLAIGTALNKDDVRSLKAGIKKIKQAKISINLNDYIGNKKESGTYLMAAIALKATKCAIYLIDEEKVDIHKRGAITDCTPLHVAIQYGNYDIAQKLLKLGADPNARTSIEKATPLKYLLEHNPKNINNLCKLLIDYKANPLLPVKPLLTDMQHSDSIVYDQNDMESLDHFRFGIIHNLSYLELLLKHAPAQALQSVVRLIPNPRILYSSASPLHKLLCKEGSNEVISMNLLHFCIKEKCDEAIGMLMNFGFDPLSKTNNGISALQMMEKSAYSKKLLLAMHIQVKKVKKAELRTVLKNPKNNLDANNLKAIISFFEPSQIITVTSDELNADLNKHSKKEVQKLLSGKSSIDLNALELAIIYKNEFIIIQLLENYPSYDVSKIVSNNTTALQLIKNLQLINIQAKFEEPKPVEVSPREEKIEEAPITINIDELILEKQELTQQFNKLHASIKENLEAIEKLAVEVKLENLKKRVASEINFIQGSFSSTEISIQQFKITEDANLIKTLSKQLQESLSPARTHLPILEKLLSDIRLTLDQETQKKLQAPIQEIISPKVKSKKKKKKLPSPTTVPLEEKKEDQEITLLNYVNSEIDQKKIVTNKSILRGTDLYNACKEIAEYIRKSYPKQLNRSIGMLAYKVFNENDQSPKVSLLISMSTSVTIACVKHMLQSMETQSGWNELLQKWQHVIEKIELTDLIKKGDSSQIAYKQFQYNSYRSYKPNIYTVDTEADVKKNKKGFIILNVDPPKLFHNGNCLVELELSSEDQKVISSFVKKQINEDELYKFIKSHKDNRYLYRCCECELAANYRKKLFFDKYFSPYGEVYFAGAESKSDLNVKPIPSCKECLIRNDFYRQKDLSMIDVPSPIKGLSLEGSELHMLAKSKVISFAKASHKKYIDKLFHEAIMALEKEKKHPTLNEKDYKSPALWAKAYSTNKNINLMSKTKKEKMLINELGYRWLKQQADFQFTRGKRHTDSLSYENAMLLYHQSLTYLNAIDYTPLQRSYCYAQLAYCKLKLNRSGALHDWYEAIALSPELVKEPHYSDLVTEQRKLNTQKSPSITKLSILTSVKSPVVASPESIGKENVFGDQNRP